jgi:hypothetical protein
MELNAGNGPLCQGGRSSRVSFCYQCGSITAALARDRTDTQATPPVRADQPPPAEPGMIPLTIPEIKRLLAALTTRPWHDGSLSTGTHGPAATRPAHDGSTNAPGSPVTPDLTWSASEMRLPYYALDIPYIARENSTAEILALRKAWARATG